MWKDISKSYQKQHKWKSLHNTERYINLFSCIIEKQFFKNNSSSCIDLSTFFVWIAINNDFSHQFLGWVRVVESGININYSWCHRCASKAVIGFTILSRYSWYLQLFLWEHTEHPYIAEDCHVHILGPAITGTSP